MDGSTVTEVYEKTVGGVLIELSQLDPDVLLTMMNAKMNLQARVITEALEEIRVYHVDPDHLGSITTISIIEETLKEATGQ